MNEQMQAALIKLIEKAQSGIDTSVSFLSAEIPDVVHQLLLWYAVKSAAWFCVSIALVCFGIHLFRMKYGVTKEEAVAARARGEAWTKFTPHYESSCTSSRYDAIMMAPYDYFAGRTAGGVIAVLGGLMTMANLNWLQILIAPKIWLIEYAARLAK